MPYIHNSSADSYEVGGKIRAAREAAGLSQNDLGALMDCSGNTISRYEIGQTSMGIDTFFKFVDALKTTPMTLSPDRYSLSERGKADDTGEIGEIISLLDGISPSDRKNLLRIARLMSGESTNQLIHKAV